MIDAKELAHLIEMAGVHIEEGPVVTTENRQKAALVEVCRALGAVPYLRLVEADKRICAETLCKPAAERIAEYLEHAKKLLSE